MEANIPHGPGWAVLPVRASTVSNFMQLLNPGLLLAYLLAVLRIFAEQHIFYPFPLLLPHNHTTRFSSTSTYKVLSSTIQIFQISFRDFAHYLGI